MRRPGPRTDDGRTGAVADQGAGEPGGDLGLTTGWWDVDPGDEPEETATDGDDHDAVARVVAQVVGQDRDDVSRPSKGDVWCHDDTLPAREEGVR